MSTLEGRRRRVDDRSFGPTLGARILRLTALIGLVALVPRAVAGVADLGGVPELVLRLRFVLHLGIVLTHVLTSVCLFLLVTGRRRPARRSAVAAIVVSAVTVLVSLLPQAAGLDAPEPLRFVAYYLPVWVATGSMLIAFTRDVPAPAARPWLIAATAAAVVTIGWSVVRGTIGTGTLPLILGDVGAWSGWAVLVGAAVLPGLRRRPSELVTWASALAITAVAVVPDRLSYLEFTRQLSALDGLRWPLVATTAQVAGLVSVAWVLAVIGINRYRNISSI
jgi:hypothetical protein